MNMEKLKTSISKKYGIFFLFSFFFLLGVLLYLFGWNFLLLLLFFLLCLQVVPRFIHYKKTQKRKKVLEKEAGYFFEVFLLALDSGKTLTGSLSFAVSNLDGILSQEFKKALEEIRFGKSLNEALSSMKKRIPSDAVNDMILTMIQSNLYGNDLKETMREQLNFLQEKRMLEAKAQISKMPIKISVISVLFFLPFLLLLILSPVVIDYFIK